MGDRDINQPIAKHIRPSIGVERTPSSQKNPRRFVWLRWHYGQPPRDGKRYLQVFPDHRAGGAARTPGSSKKRDRSALSGISGIRNGRH